MVVIKVESLIFELSGCKAVRLRNGLGVTFNTELQVDEECQGDEPDAEYENKCARHKVNKNLLSFGHSEIPISYVLHVF